MCEDPFVGARRESRPTEPRKEGRRRTHAVGSTTALAVVWCSLIFYGATAEAAKDTTEGQSADTVLREKRERLIKFRKWSADVLEILRPEANLVWRRVIFSSPDDVRSKLEKVTLDFSDDDTPLYFEANPETRESITISSGGLASIWSFSDLATLHGEKHINWDAWMEWCALSRICFLHGDPLLPVYPQIRNEAERSNPEFERIAKGLRQDALFFVLAHESGHIVMRHSSAKEKEESRRQFRERLREQETLADRFASELMLNDRKLGGSFGLVLLTSLMVFEPRGEESFESNPHPPDHLRMRALNQFILNAVENGKARSLDADAIRRLAATQRKILSSTAEQHFRDLISGRDAMIKRGIFPNFGVEYVPTP
jgi:IrrE N-terminal-like domain